MENGVAILWKNYLQLSPKSTCKKQIKKGGIGSEIFLKTEPPPEPNALYVERIGIDSLQYLREGYCTISSPSAGMVIISGKTSATQQVDRILLRLYLQRWNGSSWADIGNWLFENYNAISVSGSKVLQVPGGYYYRAKGFHQVIENGYSESLTSYSGYIYAE